MSEPSKPSHKLDLPRRPRRNRRSEVIRGLVRESSLGVEDLIYPLFIHAGGQDEEIVSMPGCTRWSLDGLLGEIEEASALGVRALVLFPAIDESLKTPRAEEAWNPSGLIPGALERIRAEFPDMVLVTDVALDPYNSDGHDGVVGPDERILNDVTVEILCNQALSHARAGADVVAPSDMMDGRVGAIRAALDTENFEDVSILAYTAKYASAFYGPFRGALESAPKSGDKKTYQMDPANLREALREAKLDTAEGPDILMVKPAGPYLDVIRRLRDECTLPLAAYQVSGEYLMIKAAAARGWLDEDRIIRETLIGIRRAGADMILTYFAKQAASLLQSP
ncbi:MAG: porphobilinogen synthase [Verrucomicrobiales bacterium]